MLGCGGHIQQSGSWKDGAPRHFIFKFMVNFKDVFCKVPKFHGQKIKEGHKYTKSNLNPLNLIKDRDL
jgi:hypothetical protein